jgi:hypothetical protein
MRLIGLVHGRQLGHHFQVDFAVQLNLPKLFLDRFRRIRDLPRRLASVLLDRIAANEYTRAEHQYDEWVISQEHRRTSQILTQS